MDGTVRFFKDGYTDLRGRFDYASVNGSETSGALPPQPHLQASERNEHLDHQALRPEEVDRVERFAFLVLSESNGAATRELAPPPGRWHRRAAALPIQTEP